MEELIRQLSFYAVQGACVLVVLRILEALFTHRKKRYA